MIKMIRNRICAKFSFAAFFLLLAFPVVAQTDSPAVSAQIENSVIAAMEDTYRGLSYYADVTTSVLSVKSANGDLIQNENKYRFVYHSEKGALVDNYLGQMFLISGWETVTNWFKAPARYSVVRYDQENDWRKQFSPVGGMMDTEHPVMTMLLDRQTGQSGGAFTILQRVTSVDNVSYKGSPAVLLKGEFIFSSQGINFAKSGESVAPGKLWIDANTGFLRKAEYDITALYSSSFGEARKASLTVTYGDIVTAAPADETLSDLFTFRPRETDVEREDLSAMFTAPPMEEEDGGSPDYLLNRPAPLFTAQTLEGENFSLADLLGKRVLLFFWATWCPNSARAMSQIEQLSKAGINDFEVIGVNVDSFVGLPVMKAYYALRGLSFTSIVDGQNEITSAYRGIFIPSAYLIDSNGVIRQIDLGETENLVERYTTALEKTP